MATKSPLTSSAQPPEEPRVDTEQIANLWFVRYGTKPVPMSYESVQDGYSGDDWLMQNMTLVVRSILRGETVWQQRHQHTWGFGWAKSDAAPALQVCVRMDNVAQTLQVYVKEKTSGDS